MRQILETEEHVPIPPIMYSDPFYRDHLPYQRRDPEVQVDRRWKRPQAFLGACSARMGGCLPRDVRKIPDRHSVFSWRNSSGGATRGRACEARDGNCDWKCHEQPDV